MTSNTIRLAIAAAATVALLAGCGSTTTDPARTGPDGGPNADTFTSQQERADSTGTTIWEAFRANRGAERTVNVNKYLWAASLEVLSFLPVESVDPFSGVILTGYGTPPGGSRAYRATILIDDPALDARALNVSLQTRNGPASASAVRAVENAILSRARQLRVADDKF